MTLKALIFAQDPALDIVTQANAIRSLHILDAKVAREDVQVLQKLIDQLADTVVDLTAEVRIAEADKQRLREGLRRLVIAAKAG